MTHATLSDEAARPAAVFPPGESALSAAIRAADWAATPFGPPESWPAVLRNTVSLILVSPVPMAILWGDEGLLLYNDGYAVISGERHPGLLGTSAISGWPEAADFNRNVVARGMRGESLSYQNQSFVLMRGGKPAEAWFDLNYSPIFDEDGRAAGVLAIVVETTGRMLEERRRRESDARFQLALNAGAVIGTWDWEIPADRFSADQRFARYFSLDPEAAAAGLPISVAMESIHPDDRERIAGLIAATMARGGPYRAEYRVLHLDGDYRWIEANGHCDLAADGTPLRFPGVLIDIDERKRTEAALRQSEAQLRAIFDTLPVGIVFAEVPSGKITGGNARVEQILGHPVLPSPSADAYGEWIAYYADGRLVPVHDYPLYVAVTTGAVTEREFHYQRGDGRRAWIRVIGGPVRNESGAITGAVITIIDIDRQKQAEAQLNELNQWLEGEVRERTRERDSIWQMSHDLLGVADEAGVWHSVNPAWERALGWPEAEIVGRTSDWIEHPEDRERTRAEVAALAGGAATHEFQNRFRHRDGSYRWLSWSAAPKDGLLYCVARDITEEKLRQAELERAQDQLRQAQKMEAIGQLTGGIAHDFNNLLTSIIGGLDMLQRQISAGRSDRIERYMKLATSSAKRAAALTHRLLAFSRKQNLDMQPTDANALVRSMEDLLRRTLGERVELALCLEEPLREALTDANLLENALLNLCINARDAMPDGGQLTIETAAVELDVPAPGADEDIQPGGYVVLSVSDTGSGMPPEVAARAFEPFFTTKPAGQGTGLGLSMIYGFVKQSGGYIRIYSEPGDGTTIKLYLPRASAPAAPAANPDALPALPAGLAALVVEDEEGVRAVTLEMLQELGCRAVAAGTAAAALELLAGDQPIDLLITDIGLPDMNGRRLADLASARRPGLPVLFVSGYAEGAAAHAGLVDAGAALLSKPFSTAALAAKIRQALPGNETGAAPDHQ